MNSAMNAQPPAQDEFPRYLREAQVAYRYNRRFKAPVGEIRDSREVHSIFARIAPLDREHLYTIFLDGTNRILAFEPSGIGADNRASIGVGGIMRTALLTGSRALILVHNHPSGDPSPSQEDRNVTVEIARAAALFHLSVFDHIIVGSEGRYFSFADNGLISGEPRP